MVSVYVPSFQETVRTLAAHSPQQHGRGSSSSTVVGTNAAQRMSSHLCERKRVEEECRVTVPLGEVLRLRLIERWWLDTQRGVEEREVLEHAERMIVRGGESEGRSGRIERSERSKRSERSERSGTTTTGEAEVVRNAENKVLLEERLVRREEEIERLERRLLAVVTSGSTRPSSSPARWRQEDDDDTISTNVSRQMGFNDRSSRQEDAAVANVVSPGDLSFAVTGTRTHNRGPHLWSGKEEEVRKRRRRRMEEEKERRKRGGGGGSEESRAMASLFKKRVEEETQEEKAMRRRPGGVRLDFIDDDNNNGNGGDDGEKRRAFAPPLESFLQQSEYVRPLSSAKKALPRMSPARNGQKRRGGNGQKRGGGGGGERGAAAEEKMDNEEMRSPSLSRLTPEQLNLARSRVAQMLAEEEEFQMKQQHLGRSGAAAGTTSTLNTSNSIDGSTDVTTTTRLISSPQAATAAAASETHHPATDLDVKKFQKIFQHTDKDSNGFVNVREMLLGLRTDPELAELLHLPSHIRQTNGTLETFERLFQTMDVDDNRKITYQEFENFLMEKKDKIVVEEEEARLVGRIKGGGGRGGGGGGGGEEKNVEDEGTDETVETAGGGETARGETAGGVTAGKAAEGTPTSTKTKRRRSLIWDDDSTASSTKSVEVRTETMSGVVRKGWLMILGKKKKSWKRRWFVLVAYDSGGASMLYFTAPIDGTVGKGTRKGALHMTSAVAIDEV